MSRVSPTASFYALSFCLLSMLPPAVSATEVTFYFTGTVTDHYGMYVSTVPIGTSVTGTYTFDLAAANPAQSSGTVGSTWISEASGGPYYGLPLPTALVFSASAQFAGFTYNTVQPSGSAVFSLVQGNTADPELSTLGQYAASETNVSTAGTEYSSEMQLQGLIGGSPPFSADGLPVLIPNITNIGANYGYFANNAGPFGRDEDINEINFTIDSLIPTPVPLPSSAWLLLSALGFLICRPFAARSVPNMSTANFFDGKTGRIDHVR